jgi:hypothetical protein
VFQKYRGSCILSPNTSANLQDHAAHPHATEPPSEATIGGRKRTNTEEAKELAQQASKEARDKYEVDRGHGVARALETVLLNVRGENKAQDMSLVVSPPPWHQADLSGFIISCEKN